MRIFVAALAVMLGGVVPAHCAALNGFVDGFGNAGAAGWACAPVSAVDVSVTAFAGPFVVGVYPRSVDRPDTAPFCPDGQPAGFSIAFDAAAQAMFTGQTQLSLQAGAAGFAPRLLPASNSATFDPMPLPFGRLLGVRASGQVVGMVVAPGGLPQVHLSAGGPADAGLGSMSGLAHPVAGERYNLELPLPDVPASLAPGALLPVFGSSTSAAGVTAALADPLPLTLNGGVPQPGLRVPIRNTVAQAGAVSGITNTVLTTWIPAGTGFAGLSGSIVFSGNDASFSEALVELGTTLDSQTTCLARNGQRIAGAPPMSRLWAGILKSNDTASVAIPVSLALAHVVAAQPGGTCLVTWVSAGYPFLSASVARYARTVIALSAAVVPVIAGAPVVTPFGVGGEFRAMPAQPGGVYVGVMATRSIILDGIAGTASAAPVVGAPAAAHWQTPGGYWSAATTFLYLPAPVCAAAHLHAQPANGPVAVLRDFTPAVFAIPAGAVPVLAMPMYSRGTQAIQRSAYVNFPGGGALAIGDCLVTYMSADTGGSGAVDVENQSTVYLREMQ